MLSISKNFLRLGALSALVGMSLGAWMGANENFTLRTVHAHINLLGFASMMLFGLFYRVFPGAAEGWLPKGHLILSVLGFLILMPTLTLLMLERPFFLPALIAAEVMLITSMLLFVIVVFRTTAGAERPVAT